MFQWYWSKWNYDFKIDKSSSWIEPKNQSGFKREVYRKYWNRKGEQRGKDGADKQCYWLRPWTEETYIPLTFTFSC